MKDKIEATIIARSGNRYLVAINEITVRIIDVDNKTVGIPLDKFIVLMNGVWEPCSDKPEILAEAHNYKWLKIPELIS